MKISLWVAIDNNGRICYSGSKMDVKSFIENLTYQVQMVELKGVYKNV